MFVFVGADFQRPALLHPAIQAVCRRIYGIAGRGTVLTMETKTAIKGTLWVLAIMALCGFLFVGIIWLITYAPQQVLFGFLFGLLAIAVGFWALCIWCTLYDGPFGARYKLRPLKDWETMKTRKPPNRFWWFMTAVLRGK